MAVCNCIRFVVREANELTAPAHRKIRIAFLLSLGLFVIAIAIVRCVLSIGNSAQVALASVWAQREAVSFPPPRYRKDGNSAN